MPDDNRKESHVNPSMKFQIDGEIVTVQQVDIDAPMAQRFLDSMVDNRPVKKRVVDGMVRSMIRGDFPFIADTVRFNDNGELIDGEHRCRAIIAASATRRGLTIPALVVWGLNPRTRMYMDQGVVRRAADQVALGLKRKNASKLAAVANILIRWDANAHLTTNLKPTTSEVYSYVEEHVGLLEIAVHHQAELVRGIGYGTAACAAVFARTYGVDAKYAEYFYEALADGVDLIPSQPLHTLRQALITRPRKENWQPLDTMFAIIRMWNAERRDETMRKLQFPAESYGLQHFMIR